MSSGAAMIYARDVLVQRMLVLVALLMAVTAVTVALAPRQVRERDARPTDPPRAAPAPAQRGATPVERDGTVPGDPPLRIMRAGESGQVVRVQRGRTLRLRVVSQELETVQLGADGPLEAVDTDSPAEFELLADADLDLEVRLVESGRTIGRVTTQP